METVQMISLSGLTLFDCPQWWHARAGRQGLLVNALREGPERSPGRHQLLGHLHRYVGNASLSLADEIG
jgi:hypothetical protein